MCSHYEGCISSRYCEEASILYKGKYCSAVLKYKGKLEDASQKAKKISEKHYKSGKADRDSLRNLLFNYFESIRWEYGIDDFFLDIYENVETNSFRIYICLHVEYQECTSIAFRDHFDLGNYEEGTNGD